MKRIPFLILGIVFSIDQLTKEWACAYGWEKRNPGALLSLGGPLDPFHRGMLLLGSAMLLGFGVFVLIRRPSLLPSIRMGLALSIGGGLGNLFDRIVRPSGVIDFIHWASAPGGGAIYYNIADIALLLGATLLCAGILGSRPARPSVTA